MTPLERARLSLEGLSVGDAFGQRFFGTPELVLPLVRARAMPRAPWGWTDDTAMAMSIYEVLHERGAIDPTALSLRFADRYRRDPRRGYGGTAHEILGRLVQREPWERASGEAFDGQGSMGNGGAMRSAPIGAYFADDLSQVVQQARASALPTHAHPDGQAGAIAVAVAAAVASSGRRSLLEEATKHTPAGPTRDGLQRAMAIPFETDVHSVAAELGSGSRVISADTVPFALWCAARHLDAYVDALWATVEGLGDRDTTCAIVGGVVACAVGWAGLPGDWRAAREPLELSADEGPLPPC